MTDTGAFRRNTALVLSAYAIPLLAAAVAAIVFGVRNADGEATPIGALAAFAFCGLAWATWRVLGDRFGGRRGERGKPVANVRKEAILREFPEFSALGFSGAGDPGYVGVSGRGLLLGTEYLPQTGGRAERMTDQLYRKLAHEARHVEVGAFQLVLAFRWMKQIYLTIGLASYTGFLANWTALLDGPDRLALMAFGAVLPYLMGAVFVVLDEMTDAFEWRLELDADRAAAARCRAAGRACSDLSPMSHRRLAQRLSDRYPPTPLRSIALIGGTPTTLQVWAPLAAGLLVAVVPVGLDMMFAFVFPHDPDRFNAVLGFLLVASLALASGILLASSLSDVGRRQRSVRRARLLPPDLAQAVAMYSIRIFSLGWTFMASAVLLLLASCVVALIASLPRGVPDPRAILVLLGMLAVARWYWRSSTDWPSTKALVRGGAGEFIRLTALLWFVSATAVFPFYNDLGGLGGALKRNPHLLAPEISRLFATEPGRMSLLAAIAACCSLVIVGLAWRGRAVGQRRAVQAA